MNSSIAEPSADPAAIVSEVEPVVRLLPRLAQRLHAALAAHAHAWGLTPAQAKVLLQIGTGGPMPVGEIAAALGSSMPAASEAIDRLVEAGLVRREDDPTDRRRVIVVPSERARRFAAEASSARSERVGQALASLSPAQRRALVVGLASLVEALGDGGGGSAAQPLAADPDPGAARRCDPSR